ncbi:hypothetical protein [Aeoliella sp. SH292]|uniref:hypothetical protein n=1 Tax=Aeoliella sp. SH292 TaxID=3454464 RepID=UPI003F986B10
MIDLLAAGLAEPGEASEPPSIDPPLADFGPCNREPGEHTDHGGTRSQTEITEAINTDGVFLEKIEGNPNDQIAQAIALTLPRGPGRRHQQVFELCRALKAIPDLSDTEPAQLKPIVQRWHRDALPMMNTKAFEETWIDFLKGWPNVLYPLGKEPMALVFDRARCAETPIEAEHFEQPELRLLVAICRELQRGAPSRPFYLSCRTAGRLLGVDHTTASRWLFLLEAEGVLAVVEKGDRRTRKASRFRYLGKLFAETAICLENSK